MLMKNVKMDVLGPMLGDPSFQQLAAKIGEIEETKVLKVLAPAPQP